MPDGYHFSISLGKTLFNELLNAALPFEIKRGEFNLTENLRQVAGQLQVKERVAGLLEDRGEGDPLVQVKERAAGLWRDNRERVYGVIDQLVRIEGEYVVELDNNGSDFYYGHQRIGAEATLRLAAEGRATLLQENLEFPFKFEKRLGAKIFLGDIRYDKKLEKIVADLQDVGINLGDNLILRTLNDLAIQLLEPQVEQYNPVPILPKAQIDEMLAPMAESPLKLKMDVEDMALDVDEDDITLKIRFGFTQLQIAGPTEGD